MPIGTGLDMHEGIDLLALAGIAANDAERHHFTSLLDDKTFATLNGAQAPLGAGSLARGVAPTAVAGGVRSNGFRGA